MVRVADQVIISEFTSEKNASDYIIVDCISGKCQQTTGYVINGSKIFGFIGDNVGADVTSSAVSTASTVTSCSEVGKFTSSKKGFCVRTGQGFEMKEKNARMIKAGSAGESTPFADAIYEVPIKNGDYFIVRNKYENGGKIKVFLINNLIKYKSYFCKNWKIFVTRKLMV